MPFNHRCCLVTNLNLMHSLLASTSELQGSMPFNNRCCLVTNLNLMHGLVASTSQLQGSMPFNNRCYLVTNLNLTHSLVASTSQLHSITWEPLTNSFLHFLLFIINIAIVSSSQQKELAPFSFFLFLYT